MEPSPISSVRADNYAQDIPTLLPSEVIRSLSRLNPTMSTFNIFREWFWIATCMFLCYYIGNPLMYIGTVMFIGAGQHALAILMHEGTHYRLYNNKKLNDFVTEVFLAWPIFVTMKEYRKDHFPHHRYVNTELDPDLVRKQKSAPEEWNFPKTWKELAIILLKDVTGLNTREQLLEMKKLSVSEERVPQNRLNQSGRIAYYLLVAALLTYFHAWTLFFLFWIVPSMTWFKVILRIRVIAEHFALEYDNFYTNTRTTHASFLDRCFIAPRDINYHIEHHLYPSIPSYNLRKAHKLLLELPEYRQKAHVSNGYLAALKECISCQKTRQPLQKLMGTAA